MEIRCFLLEPTRLIRPSWCRYTLESQLPCPLGGGHEAQATCDEVPEDCLHTNVPTADDFRDWEAECGCGYVLQPTDLSRVVRERLYEHEGSLYSLHCCPPGAMFFADWRISMKGDNQGPDGHCLVVRLPNYEEWCVDGRGDACEQPPRQKHGCWLRSGEAPVITAYKRSQLCLSGESTYCAPNWQGHLLDGVLVGNPVPTQQAAYAS